VSNFRACPSWPGYEVSDCGEVRNAKSGRMCSIQNHSLGYRTVAITASTAGFETTRGLRVRLVGVHRLVADAFIGPCPSGHEVDHLDCDKTNNTPGNLEYVTRAENMRRGAVKGRFNVPHPNMRKPWSASHRAAMEATHARKRAAKIAAGLPVGRPRKQHSAQEEKAA
jgi:hypothetical protein